MRAHHYPRNSAKRHNMGPLREVLDQLRETTETMKGAGLQFGCFTWPDGTALTVRNNGEVIITFGDVQ